MADGQQLCWWQDDEEQTCAVRGASERLAVAPSPLLPETLASPYPEAAVNSEPEHDTWSELEVEALRRSQVKTEEAESFYLDKVAALVTHRQHVRGMWLSAVGYLPLSQLMYFISYSQVPELHPYTTPLHFLKPLTGAFIGQAVTLPICFFFLNRYGRWLESRIDPTVRLSPHGIYLCTPRDPDAMLFWNDIVSVKAKGSGGRRYLELRGIKKRRFVVHESYLPCTVEVLAARIADYRSHRAESNKVKS